MTKKISSAGNAGPGVRSDCVVNLAFTGGGSNTIVLKSKVESMYGDSIRKDALGILDYFGVKGAEITIEDSGALPFVLAARIEAAVKGLIDTDKEYLLPMNDACSYGSSRTRFRFSRLYLPGNTPSMMINAGLHSADGIILDLEDSVAPLKKEEARLMVRNALRSINFYGAERMVRINQGSRGIEDLKYIVPHNVHLVLLPKCENGDSVRMVEDEIARIKAERGIKNDIFLMPIIESALGVENAFEIASASPGVVAMAIGLEDYTADLGVERTSAGDESLYARMRLVNAARAAGIQAIDSVFSDVSDMDALLENVRRSKAKGFEGMGCIHPRQIRVIHQGFAPTDKEIEKAVKVVLAFRDAEARGLGVVSLGSKMIDPPVVIRAQRTISLASELGLLPEGWDQPQE